MQSFDNKADAEQYAREQQTMYARGKDSNWIVGTESELWKNCMIGGTPFFPSYPPDGPREPWQVQVLDLLRDQDLRSLVCYHHVADALSITCQSVADTARRWPSYWMKKS
jgi:hypothetical protein